MHINEKQHVMYAWMTCIGELARRGETCTSGSAGSKQAVLRLGLERIGSVPEFQEAQQYIHERQVPRATGSAGGSCAAWFRCWSRGFRRAPAHSIDLPAVFHSLTNFIDTFLTGIFGHPSA